MTAPQHADIQRIQEQADERAFIGSGRVEKISGMSKATIGRKVKKREFPAPVIQNLDKNGHPCFTRWDLAEVLAWREEQFRKRDQRLTPSDQAQAALLADQRRRFAEMGKRGAAARLKKR